MDMKIYLIRHGQATGQACEADLTEAGERQAESLAEFLAPLAPEAVWSSPFRRAVRTAAPLARRRALPLQTDERLSEWGLAGQLREDWLERLQEAFADPDRCLPGGESGHMAMTRGLSVLEDIAQIKAARVAVITHGGLLTLLLHHFDSGYGFAEWQRLTTPDLFEVDWQCSGVRRIWQ